MERLALEAQQRKESVGDSFESIDEIKPEKHVKKPPPCMSDKEDKLKAKKKSKLYCICQTPYDKSK